MAHEFTTSFIQDSIAVLKSSKILAERAMEQAPDEGLFATLDPESNSIATIVKHLAGNMKSRWTDFLTTDGEKADRNRDAEFEAPAATRAEVMARWEQGWGYLFQALEGLSDADLGRRITIRSEPHSVMQAIHRQIWHTSYHTGQIVYLAKHFAGPNWKAITIPKKKSGG
jgi:uncharacterized damage-inducible protein DinB